MMMTTTAPREGAVVDPDHETADAAPPAPTGAPVEVVGVVASGAVSLHAQALDPDLVTPALQGARPLLDAAHRRRPRNKGNLGVAHRRVPVGRAPGVVRDGRRGVERFTVYEVDG